MNLRPLPVLFALSFAHAAFAAEPPPTDPVVFDHAKVDAAFAKGLPLLINRSYKLMTGHRVVPGVVEVHEHDTDILYFTAGAATFVTGGATVEAKPTAGDASEIRAKAITGGTEHHVGPGDIVVVPKGVPHWFKEVSGTCLYLVVKVTE